MTISFFLQKQNEIAQGVIYNVSSSESEEEQNKSSDDDEFGADITESSTGSPSTSTVVV